MGLTRGTSSSLPVLISQKTFPFESPGWDPDDLGLSVNLFQGSTKDTCSCKLFEITSRRHDMTLTKTGLSPIKSYRPL